MYPSKYQTKKFKNGELSYTQVDIKINIEGGGGLFIT